jgi:hypothetical protein
LERNNHQEELLYPFSLTVVILVAARGEPETQVREGIDVEEDGQLSDDDRH